MARRTKEDALATRTALLDAAERVFLQQGVSRTSLADIAQAASVTRGALYWHFKDKAALFSAMLDRVALPLSAELEELLNREGDVLAPWCVQMRHVLHQIAHDARARRVLQIVMQKAEHAQDLGPVLERHVARHRMSIDSLRQLLDEILGLYENSRAPIAITAGEASGADAMPPVLADTNQLRQVLHNVLTNAQDALVEVAEPRITLTVARDGARARLTVADNGSGFPPQILSRAFEPYVTTKSKGTGLGLAIVKKIVDDHGGEIRLANNHGGEVSIWLPLVVQNAVKGS